MMAFQQGDPLAVALAAAAALARNGGTFLYDSSSSSSAARPVPGSVITASASPDNNTSPDNDTTVSSTYTVSSTATSPSYSSSPVNGVNATTSRSSSSNSNSDCDEDDHDNDHDDDNSNNGNGNENDNDNDNDMLATTTTTTTSTIITNEEDAKRRMARSRERNREHARRTRRRKKAQLEALQSKVHGLKAENKTLTQSLEECRIASILVGFSVSDGDDRDGDATIQSLLKEATEIEEKDIFKKMMGGGKRTRLVSDASDIAGTGVGVGTSASCSASGSSSNNTVSLPLKIEIDGRTAFIGGDGRSHLNWKTGVYTDENGVRSLLTNQQLETLRRERNRMHAKMTRDRKKSFIATIEKTIEELESSNRRMNAVLADVIYIQKSTSLSTTTTTTSTNTNTNKLPSASLMNVTPSSSPVITPKGTTWAVSVPELMTPTMIHSVVAPMEREHEREREHVDNDSATAEGSNVYCTPATAHHLNLPPKKRVCHGFSLHY